MADTTGMKEVKGINACARERNESIRTIPIFVLPEIPLITFTPVQSSFLSFDYRLNLLELLVLRVGHQFKKRHFDR
jgi:hypothetical protein